MSLPPPQPPSAPEPNAAGTPPKNNTLLYVGLGAGCLVLLLVLIAAVGISGYLLYRKHGAPPAPAPIVHEHPSAPPAPAPVVVPAPAPVAVATPAPAPRPVGQRAAPHGTAIFVNQNRELDAFLAKNYLDAIFVYPAGWEMNEEVRKNGNGFIRVSRKVTDERKDSESFQLGAWQRNPANSDQETIRGIAQRINSAMSSNMKQARDFPLEAMRFGLYEATAWKFEGVTKDNVHLYVKVLFLPPQNQSQTSAPLLTLIAAGGPRAEVRTPDEVGIKGELPLVLNTLRWGADYTRAGQRIQQASGGAEIVFSLLDLNEDNALDGVELLNGTLLRFDSNRDGVMSGSEYAAGNPAKPAASPAPGQRPAPAPPQTSSILRPLPSGASLNDDKKVELVATTLEGFQAGIRAGTFRRFYDAYVSNLWKKQMTPAAFDKAFAAFVDARLDLAPAAFREAPVFAEDRKDGSIVKFAGHYDIRTAAGNAKVTWKLDFIYESGRGWGLTQVNIATKPYTVIQ